MVLSNYKCIHIRIQNSEYYSSNVSSNRIKIQRNSINSTTRNRLLLQVIHFRNAPFEAVTLQSSTETSRTAILHEEVLQDSSSSNYSSNPTCAHYTTIQRILHPESNSTCRRQRALRILLLQSSSRNSTHRRQGDLLEMHPCVSKQFQSSNDIPAFPDNSTMFQYFQGIHPIPAFSD